MRCTHVSLAHFRNYARLELDLPPCVSVFWGDNGQGKSNLLEAIYLLATTKSYRGADRDLIAWDVGQEDAMPGFARVAADIIRHHAHLRLDVVLTESLPPATAAETGRGSRLRVAEHARGLLPSAGAATTTAGVHKRYRLNGVPKRALDVVGQLNVVLFSPQDLELVNGGPETRRRYLDISLCQVDRRYLRTLSQYRRALLQRNALFRQLRDRWSSGEALAVWSEQLAMLGSELTLERCRAVRRLNEHLAAAHMKLAPEAGRLEATYRSSVDLQDRAAELGQRAENPDEARAEALPYVNTRFRGLLGALADRERAQGRTLVGPHLDDLGLYVGGVDMNLYGSRGQQRTVALALRLAEVQLMTAYTGERPVLLLDDVLSELDRHRRRSLQASLAEQAGEPSGQQVLVTATDREVFDLEFLAGTAAYSVECGTIRPAR